MAKQSILKKKKRKNNGGSNESKQSVSFAATSSTKFYEKERKVKAKYHEMSIDEEDALDPCSANQNDDNAKIRDARSARAIKRHTGNLEDFNQKESAVKAEDSFQGEEVADERFSLIHDGSSASNEGGDCPIEPFNLKSEREDGEGYFDGDTYVFRRGKGDEEDDAWLDDLDGKKESISTGGKRGSAKVDMKRKDNSPVGEDMSKEQAYEQLIPLLSTDEETVLQALGRYGTIVKREKKQKVKNSASGNALNKITELSNICMMNFDDGANIYDFTKEKLRNFLNQSDAQAGLDRKRKSSIFDNNVSFKDTRPTKQSKTSDLSNVNGSNGKAVLWEYRGNEDKKIHGPFSTNQMMEWIKAGYFVGQMAVDVRIVSDNTTITAEKAKEETVDDLLGDLEDSDDEDTKKCEHAQEKWLRSDSVKFETYL